MKVGDLVRHPLSGDIGIITEHRKEGDWVSEYYTVTFPNGSYLIPQEHLEVISESR